MILNRAVGKAVNPKGNKAQAMGGMELEGWVAKTPWDAKGATAGWMLRDKTH